MFIKNAVASLVIVFSALTLLSLGAPHGHKSPDKGLHHGPSKFAISSLKYHYFEWFPPNGEHSEFYVEWYSTNPVKGDIVEFRSWTSGRILYRFNRPETWVNGIMPWIEPAESTADGKLPRLGAMLITASGEAQPNTEWVIIGRQYSGKFSIVFDAGSMRTGFQYMPEFVDLDKDAYPAYSDEEIITLNWYPPMTNAKIGLSEMTAKVWKWSQARFRYVLVRHCPYVKRLEPLTFKHWR